MEDIANRDLIQLKIDMEMKKNQREMLSRLKYINDKKHNNKHLNEIARDYNRYFRNIIIEKQQVKQQMEKLLEHLDKLTIDEDLSQSMLNRLEFQKKDIRKELSRVKNSLDEILSLVE